MKSKQQMLEELKVALIEAEVRKDDDEIELIENIISDLEYEILNDSNCIGGWY